MQGKGESVLPDSTTEPEAKRIKREIDTDSCLHPSERLFSETVMSRSSSDSMNSDINAYLTQLSLSSDDDRKQLRLKHVLLAWDPREDEFRTAMTLEPELEIKLGMFRQTANATDAAVVIEPYSFQLLHVFRREGLGEGKGQRSWDTSSTTLDTT